VNVLAQFHRDDRPKLNLLLLCEQLKQRQVGRIARLGDRPQHGNQYLQFKLIKHIFSKNPTCEAGGFRYGFPDISILTEYRMVYTVYILFYV